VAKLTRIALVVAAVAMVVVAWRLGVFRAAEDPRHLADELVALGVWGYVAFVVAYAVLQPFGLPGTVFVFAAPLIWRWPVAFALSMIGTMAATSVGFLFSRFVARDFIAPRVPQRFRKYDEALERRAFVTVLTLRFIFWMPPLLHAFFGISKVRFWTHFWASFVGYLVPLFLVSFFGQRVVDWMKNASPTTWVSFGAGIVVIGLAVWIRKRSADRARAIEASRNEENPA
jgi:uncharacterized membrane protein YdjX (TVP38/TMEM64 family)